MRAELCREFFEGWSETERKEKRAKRITLPYALG